MHNILYENYKILRFPAFIILHLDIAETMMYYNITIRPADIAYIQDGFSGNVYPSNKMR